MITAADKARRRARVEAACAALPEVEITGQGGQHMGAKVRGRTVVWLTDDHQGDGIFGLVGKAPPGVQQDLIASRPERFFPPMYLHHRGWIGLRMDRETVDWDEVDWVVRQSYRLVAPKRLAALVPA
jgi:hypothetical protein